jgi:hypothetical protein
VVGLVKFALHEGGPVGTTGVLCKLLQSTRLMQRLPGFWIPVQLPSYVLVSLRIAPLPTSPITEPVNAMKTVGYGLTL